MKKEHKTIIIIFFTLFGYVAFGHFVFGNCSDAFLMGSFLGAGIATYFIEIQKLKFRN